MLARRLLLGGALAAPLLRAGTAAAQTAPAAPAAGPAQAPGFYRFRTGKFLVTVVTDGDAFRANPTQGMAVNASPADVERALREASLPVTGFSNSYSVTVVEADGKTVLFDTGTGGQLQATAGKLPQNLAAAGYELAKMDVVVITHFHPDHITGLTTRENAAVFPAAQIVVPQVEWAWWSDEANSPRTPEGQRGAFANTKRRFAPYQARMRQVTDGQEVLPGIRAIATHGHTPGHTSYHLADGNEQLFVIGDCANRPEIFLRYPDWHFSGDVDGPAAAVSRKRIFGQAADARARLIGYHFPFPSNGYVARAGEGFRYVPAEWSSAI